MPNLPPKVLVSVLLNLFSLTSFAGEMQCPPNEYLQGSADLLLFKNRTPITDTLFDYTYQANDAFKWNGLNWALFVDAAANNDKDALMLAKRNLATPYWAHIWSANNVCRYYGHHGMIEARSYGHSAELNF